MRSVLVALVMLSVALAGCHGMTDSADEATPTIRFGSWSLPAGSPALHPAEDCNDLLAALNARVLSESDARLNQSLDGRPMIVFDAFAAEDGATAPSAPRLQASSGTAADAEVTGTNNQESGVDEADILKTDGEWTYVLRDRHLHILHSVEVGDVEPFATVELGHHERGVSLLLEPRDPDDPDDDRLIVLTSTWQRPTNDEADDEARMSMIWHGGQTFTRLRVYDLADRSAPDVVEESWIEGSVSGARLVDGTAYVVVTTHALQLGVQNRVNPDGDDFAAWGLDRRAYYEMDEGDRRALMMPLIAEARAANRAVVANLTLDDHLPEVLRPGPDGELEPVPHDTGACTRFLLTEEGTGRTTTTILALDAAAATLDSQVTQVTGSSPIVYAADDALVLASPSRDGWWFWGRDSVDEATDLHWFDLDGLDVTHRASGRTPGTVQDSFGIDVHDGHLRVTTTTGQWGRWWMEDPEPMMNHLVVYDARGDELVPKGNVSGIAPGERIWASRFTDDRAYVITFEQIDPLWIIDLSDPTQPTILGELEIPGVSTYIHPLSDDLLLAIGMGPGPDGTGLDRSRLQVSLFDISDPTDPRRADLLDVAPPGGHSWSGALHEHKAFTYWDAVGVLAIPLTTHERILVGGAAYQDHRYEHHVALRLIDVDEENRRLSVRGEVDHDGLLSTGGSGGSHYWGAHIERSYFLGFPETGEVSVYAMSGLGVTAHDLSTLTLQDAVAFEEAPHRRVR